MANEGTLTFSILVEKIPPMVSAKGENLTDFLFSVSSGLQSQGVVLISHTALTAIPLGQVTAPGFAVLINTDPTNFITVYNGNGGTSVSKMAKLMPGWPMIVPIDPTCVPYAEADTLDCFLSFLIYSR